MANRIPRISNRGNIIATKIPAFKLPEAAVEIYPTRVGPPEHPKSPANAKKANIAVPPFFIRADALLKLPGHMMPTERPHTAQPIREITGDGDKEIHKYDKIQSTPLPSINLSKLILSPYFP